MRDKYVVVIAVNAPLLRIGLENILRKTDILSRASFVIPVKPETVGEVMLTEKPDLVLISPELVGTVMTETLKHQSRSEDTKMVAVLTTLYQTRQLNGFDAKLSLMDSPEEIRRTVKKLLIEEVETISDNEQQTLTPREKEIVVGVVKGLTNREIAKELCLSTHTVITHRRNIAKKLQIHSPSGLTIYAIVNKLVELKDIKEEIQN